ncbi:PH and SEC7 domain-containing protein-like isoform X1 [Tachypleus tridentatus]|uniref:PH and SEC7 domain-containing protein-like isoform X1 n=1 Tax=Tachypleus tridentatus TaxID=6853 RepID=UPI003FCF80EE
MCAKKYGKCKASAMLKDSEPDLNDSSVTDKQDAAELTSLSSSEENDFVSCASKFGEEKSLSYNRGFVRFSKSEDQLQKNNSVTIFSDVEEDIATSLNPLLRLHQGSALDIKYRNSIGNSTFEQTLCSGIFSISEKDFLYHSADTLSRNCDEVTKFDTADGDLWYQDVFSEESTKVLQRDTSKEEENVNDDSEELQCSHYSDNVIPNDSSTSGTEVGRPDEDHSIWFNELESESKILDTSVDSGSFSIPKKYVSVDGVTSIVVDRNIVCLQVTSEYPQNREHIFSGHDENAGTKVDQLSDTDDKAVDEVQETEWEDNSVCVGMVEKNGEVLPCDAKTDEVDLLVDEDVDIDALCAPQPCPKAVDIPSASRLAKRLFNLEGFKRCDVARHLYKNDGFSIAVAEEYLKFFVFTSMRLDEALHKFLKECCLSGETQERERILYHFSKRYYDNNPGSFKSLDSVHTLTCSLMLLNTDLHANNVGSKMTFGDFVKNLSSLNDGEDYPKELLKELYYSIKSSPLEWTGREDIGVRAGTQPIRQSFIGHNPFLEVPDPTYATEYKKGYVLKKCCLEPGGKKTPLGKRGWKMFYATLRDMVLFLHKDEHSVGKNQLYNSLHNAVHIHHCLATMAVDYRKKRHVFRLQTAEQAEYLFQTGDSADLVDWVNTINFVAASLSSPPLPTAVGSQQRFQRPLLPVSHTKLSPVEQLKYQESLILELEKDLDFHLSQPPEQGGKPRITHEFSEKEAYLRFELQRYKTYVDLLQSRLNQEQLFAEHTLGEVDEDTEIKGTEVNSSVTKVQLSSRPGRNRVGIRSSYLAAIYNNEIEDCY